MEVLGLIDVFSPTKISGWVFEKGSENSIEVVLKRNDSIIARTVANMYRKDLEEKEIHPTGNCGFVFDNFEVDQDISLFDLKVEVLATSIVIEHTPVVRSYLNNLLTKKYINQEKKANSCNRVCHLHVGVHKTGSSSIQNSLIEHHFVNETKYLKIGFANHSIPFYSLFTNEPEKYHINRKENRSFIDCLKFNKSNLELIDKVLSSSSDNMIISGEDISVLPADNLKVLKCLLDSYFDTIKVYIYIRDPHSFISSDFQELIKNGLSGVGFNRLFSGVIYPDYQKIISKFDTVFEQTNVDVRLFDKNSLIGGDVVQDFICTLDLDETIKTSSTNVSLSLEEASILYLFNNYYLLNKVMNQELNAQLLKLRSLIQSLAANKFELSSQLTKELIASHLSDIEWTSRRTSIDRSKLLNNIADAEHVISSAEQLEEIGWSQLVKLVSKLEGKVHKEKRIDLLNRFIDTYL